MTNSLNIQKKKYSKRPQPIKIIKKIERCILVFLATVAICVALQFASTFLPLEPMQSHVADEVGLLEINEENGFKIAPDIKYLQDVYTDGIMLNMSVPYKSASHIQNAFSASFWEEANPGKALATRAAAWEKKGSQYLRYWHGYIVPLRILLTFFTYSQIQKINVFMLSGLVLCLAFLLDRRFNFFLGVSFLLAVFCIGFVAVPLSMQFVGVFYISFLTMLFELIYSKNHDLRTFIPELFVVVGTLTVWIDFLTAPIITLGLPLLLALLISRDKLFDVWSSSAAWISSYAVFWAMRWVLAGMMYPQTDIIGNVSNSALIRLGESGGASLKISAIAKNLAMIFGYPRTLKDVHLGHRAHVGMGIIITMVTLVILLWAMKRFSPNISQLWPFALVGIYPFVWYIVLANHSFVHSYFTYRDLSITFFAAACTAYQIGAYKKPSLRQC